MLTVIFLLVLVGGRIARNTYCDKATLGYVMSLDRGTCHQYKVILMLFDVISGFSAVILIIIFLRSSVVAYLVCSLASHLK